MKKYLQTSCLADVRAGFITAIVALPLALAFAIASGVEPKTGMITAIVAGVLAALVGSSPFSITGPTGAMTIVILAVVNRFGLEGLMLAGFLAGVIQLVFSLLRLGEVVSFIPLPVVSGFTSGIGAIILIGQLPNFFGLEIPAREHVWESVADLLTNAQQINVSAVMLAAGSLGLLVWLPRKLHNYHLTKNIPASMLVLVIATLAAIWGSLAVPVVGTIPRELPNLGWPSWSWSAVREILPSAFTIAMLGSIEALLCAVVCDGMTGQRHDPNRELRGQGIANLLLPLIGGMPATAAIARSAVNIREGAKTRFAAVFHSLFLLAVMLVFSAEAERIPKAFLAAILVLVSLRMINWREFVSILRISRADAAVLLCTFSLTVLTDLVFAVQVGMLLAIFLLFLRLTRLVAVSTSAEYDKNEGLNAIIQADAQLRENVAIYSLHGPFFFGAINVFERKFREHVDVGRRIVVLRMRLVPFVDSTGLECLREFIREHRRRGGLVLLSGLATAVENTLRRDEELSELFADGLVFKRSRDALEGARELLKPATT